jgi:hypothetical protein
MDICFNVIGPLFFVVAYTAMSSFDVRGKVTTPIVTLGKTEGVIFEGRGNTILFPGVDALMKSVVDTWKDLESKGVSDWDERVKRLQEAGIGNEFYTFRGEESFAIVGGGLAKNLTQVLVPKLDVLGEDGAKLLAKDSTFRRELAKLDPTKQHIFFVVRTDSFEVFHTARRAAIEAGFRVGWTPHGEKDEIRFGGGGVVDVGETGG